jgi:hypothetical protein
MLFGLERYRETRLPLYLLLPAACLAVQIYIAYTPGWVTTAVVLGIYGVVRFAPDLYRRDYRVAVNTGAAFALAAVIGALLGAYSLFPSIADALGSSYQQDRALGLAHLPLEDAWTYLFPDYWGTEDNWIGVGGNYPEWVAYTAITAAPLALLGFWHMRRHWSGWFCAILLVFCASQVFGIPPVKELAHLPGLKQVAAGRWFFGINLVAAMMAPAGVAMLMSDTIQPRVRYRLIAALAAMFALALLAVVVLSLDSDDANWVLISEGQGLLPSLSEIFDGYGTHLHRQMGLLLLAVGLAAFALFVPRRAILACSGIVAIGFIDLFAFGYDYNGTIDRDDLYPTSPGIEFLQQDTGDFRIAPVASDGRRQVFPGFTANLFGLRTITGYDHYRDEDYLTFIDPLRSQNDRDITELYGYVPVGANRTHLNPNILRLLNVKYVVTEPTGLYEGTGGEPANSTAFPVYGAHSQGQVFEASAEDDAIELLLATAGGPGPESDIVFHIRSSPTIGADLVTTTIDGREVADNSWHVVPLPQMEEATDLYIEVEVPDANAERPLLLWGVPESDAGDRYDSGEKSNGTLTHRVLDAPEWADSVYEGDDLAIYEVEGTLPVAWGVLNSTSADDLGSAVNILTASSFDPASTVVLTEDSDSPTVDGTAETEVVEYDSQHARIQTDFPEDGYVVFSIPYDNGWHATVDGEGAEILPANGLLQAVPVEEGVHEVEIEFRPAEYVWGQRISLVTLVSLLLGGMAYVGYSQRRRFRRSSGDQISS